jgi:hypothetical protein
MEQHEKVLYKRTQDGGFVFWKGELRTTPAGITYLVASWGNINGTSQNSEKQYGSYAAAVAVWKSTWSKKYAVGLYKTLDDLFITEPVGGVTVYKGQAMTLYKALGLALPPLGSTPTKALKIPKSPKPEPVEKINRNIKIVFQLPRLN